MSYVVTAFCSRPWCHVKEFATLRARMNYEDAQGVNRPIRHVRCPRCNAQAPIVKTQEVA